MEKEFDRNEMETIIEKKSILEKLEPIKSAYILYGAYERDKTIFVYRGLFNGAYDLTPVHKEKVKEMEESDTNMTVYAIIEGAYRIGEDTVEMTSYLYLYDGEEIEFEPHGDNATFRVYANVVTEEWQVEECGIIGISITPTGGLKRVF